MAAKKAPVTAPAPRYTPDTEDLRAFSSFDANTQAALRAGRTITAGDGRKFVLIDGHATAVGSDSYTRGMAARQQNAAGNPRDVNGPNAPGGTSFVGSADDTGPVVAPPAVTPPDPVATSPGAIPSVSQAAADAKTAADFAKANSQKDAYSSLKDTLGQYGLDGLAGFAWTEIQNGRTPTEVLQDIRETPQFDQRFPAIKQRMQAGLPALSPSEYVAYEKTATEYMRAAGLPQGFYDDHADFTKFLANDVSLSELANRVTLAKDAAFNAPTETRQALRGQFGLGDGDLAAFFLNPDRAEPLLQRTFNAANIAGAATRTGYNTSADQDYRLADLGVSAGQAQTGFDQLGHEQQLFNPLTGHPNEGQISTDTQLAAQFGGNSNAQDIIERRRLDRQAEFQAGGGFAQTQQGLSGLGVSQK